MKDWSCEIRLTGKRLVSYLIYFFLCVMSEFSLSEVFSVFYLIHLIPLLLLTGLLSYSLEATWVFYAYALRKKGRPDPELWQARGSTIKLLHIGSSFVVKMWDNVTWEVSLWRTTKMETLSLERDNKFLWEIRLHRSGKVSTWCWAGWLSIHTCLKRWRKSLSHY